MTPEQRHRFPALARSDDMERVWGPKCAPLLRHCELVSGKWDVPNALTDLRPLPVEEERLN